ncbi:MAG: PD40 domain-containing protein [Notoacmeibacter sp.]|nr:PD40 domain-containing protein [Notoacmeibacter sp.]
MISRASTLTGLAAAALLAASSAGARGAELAPGTQAKVIVRGYDGDVMEPFLTRDGKVLLFNNSNARPERTNLHAARAVSSTLFAYAGPLDAINSGALDAVASTDDTGKLYFVSTADYLETRSTLFAANLTGAKAAMRQPVHGLARGLGWLHFDAEISADGTELYVAEGRFTGKPVPDSADLVLARRTGDGFAFDRSDPVFDAVNTDALEYAPCVSRDGLTLYFTRLEKGAAAPQIHVARRNSRDAAYEASGPLPLDGFVEAAALSPDEKHIYFHRKTPDGYRLFVYAVEEKP